MDQLGYAAEIIATFSESAVALAAVTSICKPRYRGFRHVLLLSLFSAGLTAIVLLLNEISLFSYITPIAAILFVTLISSRVTSVGSLLCRCSFCIFAYTVIQTLDYVTLVFFGLGLGIPQTVFTELMEPGLLRVTYILTAKFLDVALYLVLRPIFRKIEKLSRKLQIFFFGLSIVTYVYMQFLFSTIVSTELSTMQFAVILSWLFLLCFVAAVFALFSSLTRAKQNQHTQELLQEENAFMAENYKVLNSLRQEYAKELHDFKHHLTAIKELALGKKQESIPAYVDSLLEARYQHTAVCSSGSDIVDAIINCKYAEAQALSIDFAFTANLHAAVSIDPVDICGVLANQIDNAFDACKKIPAEDGRKVKVEVKQVQDMVFLKVGNTVAGDPFAGNRNLRTTKPDLQSRHGFGLENIRSIADRYGGCVRNEYKDGWFISSVSLSNRADM